PAASSKICFRLMVGLNCQSKSSRVLSVRKSAALVRRASIRWWRTLSSSWQISSRNSPCPRRPAAASCRRTSSVWQLRLSGLSQTLDVRLQEAAAGRLGHGEFLELICQDKLNVRHQRMLARRTKAADFRTLQTLE